MITGEVDTGTNRFRLGTGHVEGPLVPLGPRVTPYGWDSRKGTVQVAVVTGRVGEGIVLSEPNVEKEVVKIVGSHRCGTVETGPRKSEVPVMKTSSTGGASLLRPSISDTVLSDTVGLPSESSHTPLEKSGRRSSIPPGSESFTSPDTIYQIIRSPVPSRWG